MGKCYFNREFSWLAFNRRVLEEAQDRRHPLLERAKFLAIVHANLDEFFMIRVSGLLEQVGSGVSVRSDDGTTPAQQLAAIRRDVTALLAEAWKCFEEDIEPKLRAEGIVLQCYADLTAEQVAEAHSFYDTHVFPVLTPLAVDQGHPFPHISNLSLSLAVVLRGPTGQPRFARVKIPDVFPRLVPLASDPGDAAPRGRPQFVRLWLEDLVAAHLAELFRGMEVVASYPFRVIRDADLEIWTDEAGDLLQSIEQSLHRRRFGSVSLLAVAPDMPDDVRAMLADNMSLPEHSVYSSPGRLGLSDLMALTKFDLPDLKDRPFRAHVPAEVDAKADIFAAIRRRDILLHHPFDSFAPVVRLVEAAAADPFVLAIKQTIYRAGSNSPIVAALSDAARSGKQVSVQVELKARFDEENNIEWARALERAGAHVVYGDVAMKTHAKLLMIVRQDTDGIRRYLHLGTGNYNVRTAEQYTDLGLLTCDADLAEDVTDLFNALTGYSVIDHYRKLLVSPGGIRAGIVERIQRSARLAEGGAPAQIILKMNSLTDRKCIDGLYKASQAGVRIHLIIRGSCCLVPGVPGLSENITVTSIVGRFLEHSRVFCFSVGGGEDWEVWLGSADLMERNLDRRVESLFPILDPVCRKWITSEYLPAYMRDVAKSRTLTQSGTYERAYGDGEGQWWNAQEWFMQFAERQTRRQQRSMGLRKQKVSD